jgi:hypothetical protein
MRAVSARDVGLAVRSNVVARERRSVMMSERRVVKDGVEGEGGVPSVRHPGQNNRVYYRFTRFFILRFLNGFTS